MMHLPNALQAEARLPELLPRWYTYPTKKPSACSPKYIQPSIGIPPRWQNFTAHFTPIWNAVSPFIFNPSASILPRSRIRSGMWWMNSRVAYLAAGATDREIYGRLARSTVCLLEKGGLDINLNATCWGCSVPWACLRALNEESTLLPTWPNRWRNRNSAPYQLPLHCSATSASVPNAAAITFVAHPVVKTANRELCHRTVHRKVTGHVQLTLKWNRVFSYHWI